LQLPGIDGLELTRRLKADPARKDIRILALTAYAMKGDEEKARAAGCDGYLTKPIDTRTLAARVRLVLDTVEDHDPGSRAGELALRAGGAQQPEPSAREAGAPILVVEDNPITRKMIV